MMGIVVWMAAARAEDTGSTAAPAEVDISAALEKPKKGKWDPKGKAIDPYGRGDAKRKQEAWAEAIPLLVEALDAQPGCGKCLDSLSRALDGAKRYADAVKVGTLMTELYPDKNQGWARIATAHIDAEEFHEAVDATSHFLEVTKDDSYMWWQRNRLLLQLADYEGAEKWLTGAADAGLSAEDAACLKVQILAATGKPVEARELWPTCDAGSNADLKRYSEGWVALAEGDKELAATKLVMAGADDFGRLTIAFIRIDQGKFDMAHNLASKLLEDTTWALDGWLADAEALHGLGKDVEARKILDEHLVGDGWQQKQAAFTLQQVLLKPNGATWPQEVGKRAALLQVAILAGTGDTPAAAAFAADVAEVYGESPALQAALDAHIGGTGVSRAQLAAATTASAPALKKCFDKDKKKNASLAGAVVVGFTIGADGAVTGAATKSSTLTGAPDLEKCTLDEIGKWKLPVVAGATPASAVWTVSYPLP